MKSLEPTKKGRSKQFSYHGFNIKLQSNDRSGTNVYSELFTSIDKRNSPIPVSKDKAIVIKSHFKAKRVLGPKSYELHHGKFVRFTLLDPDNWYNLEEKELSKYETPKNLYPNGRECDYVFIPHIHRLYFLQGIVSPYIMQKYLEAAFKQVIGSHEEIVVHLIQSIDQIERIINASELKRLEVSLTYANPDVTDDTGQLLDSWYKESQAGHIDTVFKPDHNKVLNGDSTLIKAILGIAQDNGEATATIKNEDGKTETIHTQNYPEKRTVYVKPDENPYDKLFEDVMRSNPSSHDSEN